MSVKHPFSKEESGAFNFDVHLDQRDWTKLASKTPQITQV